MYKLVFVIPSPHLLSILQFSTYVITIIFARQKTSTADNAANYVRYNCAVQIGHVHHLELMRIRYQLHATIIDNHVVVLDIWIVFGHATRRLQEQAVADLHNVGLVDGCHFVASGTSGCNRQARENYYAERKQKWFSLRFPYHIRMRSGLLALNCLL